jgi:hypothetical protein
MLVFKQSSYLDFNFVLFNLTADGMFQFVDHSVDTHQLAAFWDLELLVTQVSQVRYCTHTQALEFYQPLCNTYCMLPKNLNFIISFLFFGYDRDFTLDRSRSKFLCGIADKCSASNICKFIV